jgi:hypothetical protein
MKKSYLLLIAISIIILYSCEKGEIQPVAVNKPTAIGSTPNPDPNDNAMYYDNDPDCDNTTSGNCCDVDGRILIIPGHSYIYTYDGRNNGNTTLSNIAWEVKSGSITIIGGQNTTEAELKFGEDFTEGTISAMGLVNGDSCQNTLTISKL